MKVLLKCGADLAPGERRHVPVQVIGATLGEKFGFTSRCYEVGGSVLAIPSGQMVVRRFSDLTIHNVGDKEIYLKAGFVLVRLKVQSDEEIMGYQFWRDEHSS